MGVGCLLIHLAKAALLRVAPDAYALLRGDEGRGGLADAGRSDPITMHLGALRSDHNASREGPSTRACCAVLSARCCISLVGIGVGTCMCAGLRHVYGKLAIPGVGVSSHCSLYPLVNVFV